VRQNKAEEQMFSTATPEEANKVAFIEAAIQSEMHIRSPPNTRMQHDRFAREIVGILALSYAARLRRLMRNPLGRPDTLPKPKAPVMVQLHIAPILHR